MESEARFTQPVQGGNVVPLFCLAAIYVYGTW